SWGIRRWAMTTKLAAATSATKNIATPPTTNVNKVAATSSGTCDRDDNSREWSPGGRKSTARCSLESTNMVTDSELAKFPGASSANSSSNLLGFSTRPTTVRGT